MNDGPWAPGAEKSKDARVPFGRLLALAIEFCLARGPEAPAIGDAGIHGSRANVIQNAALALVSRTFVTEQLRG